MPLERSNFLIAAALSAFHASDTRSAPIILGVFFFFNDPATTKIYTSSHTLSLHDALPISHVEQFRARPAQPSRTSWAPPRIRADRKSTRLNSSHVSLSRMPSSA